MDQHIDGDKQDGTGQSNGVFLPHLPQNLMHADNNPNPYWKKYLTTCPAFSGTLVKMQLTSNCCGYGRVPKQGTELEQRLTITAKGRVWLSYYCSDGVSIGNDLLAKKETFAIDKTTAQEILAAVGRYFSIPYPHEHSADDAGLWDITLTNTQGEIYKFSGSLVNHSALNIDELGTFISYKLNRDNLFLFNGACDSHIYKIERKPDDYIFCYVSFENSNREYCYLADSEEFDEGDKVIVPTGADNVETRAYVKSIEYHKADHAPYPLEKIKHIIRKSSDNAIS